jgi:hypothetical protein
MKKSLALILFIFTASLLFAQTNYQDVVHLKNGSIIRGIIVENVLNKSIKIETADRNVFVFQYDEIEKLTKEATNQIKINPTDNQEFKRGYKGLVETGYQIGVGDYGIDRLKLNIINGYQFNQYLYLGLGTGVRHYYDEGTTLAPIFTDFRVNFLDRKISPYISIGIGYSFNAEYHFEDVGLMFNPSVGVSFKLLKKTAVNVALDYEMQQAEYYDYGNYYHEKSNENIGAIGITVGISF